jgi:hypothetical protein
MLPKWYKQAELFLPPEDKIEKSYAGWMDKNYGYLVISHERLLFVSEKGLFRKKFEIMMNEPINGVKMSNERRYGFDLDYNDSHHIFISDEAPIRIVEKSIRSYQNN